MSPEIDVFTLRDKYNLMLFALFVLCINVGLFVRLESLSVAKKIQIQSKKKFAPYIFCIIMLSLLLSIFVTIPYVGSKTIEFNEKLYYFDDNISIVDGKIPQYNGKLIEDAYYPAYKDSVISWYTRDFKDQRYLKRENVSDITYYNQIPVYNTNNSKYLIHIAQKPKENRGIETHAFWYSITFVVYNFFFAIFAYPLFSLLESEVKLLWKSQNMISNMLLAIMISYTFMF